MTTVRAIVFVFALDFFFFISSLFQLQYWDPCQPRFAGPGYVRQAMFRAPFLAPFSCHGGEQCIPKEGCSVTQYIAGFYAASVSRRRPVS
jgi:hypothetical protein